MLFMVVLARDIVKGFASALEHTTIRFSPIRPFNNLIKIIFYILDKNNSLALSILGVVPQCSLILLQLVGV